MDWLVLGLFYKIFTTLSITVFLTNGLNTPFLMVVGSCFTAPICLLKQEPDVQVYIRLLMIFTPY